MSFLNGIHRITLSSTHKQRQKRMKTVREQSSDPDLFLTSTHEVVMDFGQLQKLSTLQSRERLGTMCLVRCSVFIHAEDSDRQVHARSLSPESHWVINVWMTHLILLHSHSQSFWDWDLHHSSLLQLSVSLSSLSHWKLSPPPLKPRTKISGKLNQEKKQFQIFQYYMITLCFPLFQSDQSMHLCDSNSLVLLTEESYSGKALVAWVNNSVLERAEQIGSVVPLCFPTALPLPLREYTTCVLGTRGDGSDGREETLQLLTASDCFVSLFLTST